MQYNDVCLLKKKEVTTDEIGNQIESVQYTSILCGVKSVGRREYYEAAERGLKPEMVIAVKKYEYDGQRAVRVDGVEYEVIRSYSANIEEVELTLQRT